MCSCRSNRVSATFSWIVGAILAEISPSTNSETTHNIRMEFSGNIRVLTLNEYTITDIYVTRAVWLATAVDRGIDWSTVFSDGKDTSSAHAWLEGVVNHTFYVLGHWHTFSLSVVFICDARRSCVVMEHSLALRMSKTPVDLLFHWIGISYFTIHSRIKRVNPISGNTIKHHNTRGRNSPGCVNLSWAILGVLQVLWDIRISWPLNVANHRV